MPSKTAKQARAMAASCHNKTIREKLGIPKKVACEFHAADKAKGIKAKLARK